MRSPGHNAAQIFYPQPSNSPPTDRDWSDHVQPLAPEPTVAAPQFSLSPGPQPRLDIILGSVVSKLVHLTDVKMVKVHTIDTLIDSILLRQ